ncbi:MAG: 4Fe-4S binding protein [Promethearchaeota archaeon]
MLKYIKKFIFHNQILLNNINMSKEKLFPININPNLCIRCQKCFYSCHPKAIFFKNSMRYVNYEQCQGCLKCVEVCERGAIEVISLEEGMLKGFFIDPERCTLCCACLKDGFCFYNLFKLAKNTNNEKRIQFHEQEILKCSKCLKCVKSCPNNAILPIIG